MGWIVLGNGIPFRRGGGKQGQTYWTTRYLTDLEVTATSSTEQTITATIVGTGADGISWEYSTDGDTYTQKGTSVLGSYNATGLTPGTQYLWKARLYKGSHYGTYSNVASGYYPSTILNGLQHYWKLDETAGSALDYWGSATGIVNATQGATGKFNYGYDFNGTNNYVYCGAIPGITASTVSFWSKRDTLSRTGVIVGFVGLYGGIGVGENGNIYLIKNDGGVVAQWNGVWTDKTAFHNVVITTSAIGAGSTVELFFDNISQGSQVATTEAMTNFVLGNCWVNGTYTSPQLPFDGTIDDVGLWNRVLTPTEITALATPSAVFNEASPVIMEMTSVQTATIRQVKFYYKIDVGYTAFIDWGDGFKHQLIADGVENNVTSSYLTNNTTYTIGIYGCPDRFKAFVIGANDSESPGSYTIHTTISDLLKFIKNEKLRLSFASVTGNIDLLPRTLTYICFYHLDAPDSATTIGPDLISGSLDNLPTGLTHLQLEFCSSTMTGSLNSLPVGITMLGLDFNNLYYDGGQYAAFTGDINSLPASMTDCYIIAMDHITGSTDNLPVGLTVCQFDHTPLITGSINSLPAGLVNLLLRDMGDFTGSIANLPVGIVYLVLDDIGNAITGNINTLNAAMEYLIINKTAVTGDIESISSASLTALSISRNNVTYGGGATPAWASVTTLTFYNDTASATIDNLLIAWGTSATGTTVCTTLFSNARTAASDAAVAHLLGTHNKTITTQAYAG